MMALSHRLKQPMDERPDEIEAQVPPKRIAFLSVEGNVTEKDYFTFIHKYREQLGIDAVIHIETLGRGDTRSDPESVLELLEDYLELRGKRILPEEIQAVLENAGKNHYTLEQIRQYLDGELESQEWKQLNQALRLAGIDIDYQKFLSEYAGEEHNDVFGIVIDRDHESHTEEQLRTLQKNCKDKKCYCFLQNPCFEFWLLLHICDVAVKYKDNFDDILQNEKCSAQHTYISRELSKQARHTKKITEGKFKEYYLPNVDNAITRAEAFEQTEEGLLTKIGTNLPELFRILREAPEIEEP